MGGAVRLKDEVKGPWGSERLHTMVTGHVLVAVTPCQQAVNLVLILVPTSPPRVLVCAA